MSIEAAHMLASVERAGGKRPCDTYCESQDDPVVYTKGHQYTCTVLIELYSICHIMSSLEEKALCPLRYTDRTEVE